MLFVCLLFVIGCDDDASEKLPETAVLDEPAFSYDPRLGYTNIESALAAAANNPDFPEVSVTLRPTFPSINIPGTAKAEVSLTISEETCRLLDSSSHLVMNGLPKRPLPPSVYRRHNMSRWTLFNPSSSDFTFANVIGTWHNELPGQELVMGYWICSNGNSLKTGSFVEGPEFEMHSQIPTQGKAVYTGYLTGMHTYYYGPTWVAVNPAIPHGLKEVGEFIAPMILVADFDKGTLRGCVACVENLETSGFGVGPQGQRFYPPEGTLYTDLSFNSTSFEPVGIGEDGRFKGTEFKFRLGNPALGYNLNSTGGQGAWEGRFSGLLDDDNAPRGIAGSLQGSVNYEDGSNSRYIATFVVSKVVTGF